MFDPKKLVVELETYMSEIIEKCIVTPENYMRINHIAALLSSLLPKISDTSICEIDDIIYGDYECDVAGRNLTSEENISYLLKECFVSIFDIFKMFIEKKIDCGRTMEMALLQLLELALTDFTLFNTYWQIFFRLLWMKFKYSTLCLKFMKIMTNQECDIHLCFWDELEDMLLSNIVLNAGFDNMHEKRRALWLSEQSKFILKGMEANNNESYYGWSWSDIKLIDATHFKYLSRNEAEFYEHKDYDETFLKVLMGCQDRDNKFDKDYRNIHLHRYFSSARDNEEKMQKILDFVTVCLMCKVSPHESCDPSLFETDRNSVIFFSQLMADSIFHLIQDVDKYPSSYMVKLQSRHKYDIGTYLSRDNYSSAYLTFKEETVELVDKYFGEFKCSDDDDSDILQESLCEREKLSFYHKFMKGLQLLEILHATWLVLEDIENLRDIVPGFIAHIFRPKDSPIKHLINEFIKDPLKRGRVDWWIPFLIKKCPFLIQSYRQESQMKNLILLMKGKNIGKAEELLYFTINGGSLVRNRDSKE